MKKYLIVLLLCLPLAARAQEAKVKGHTLLVFAENGEKFFLILDGRRINDKPAARVEAGGLEKGYYRGKVIFDDERLPAVDGNLQCETVDNPGGFNEVTYFIRKKVKKGKVSYVFRSGDFKALTRATELTNTAGELEAGKGHPPITGTYVPPSQVPDPVSPTGAAVNPAGTALVPCQPPAELTEIRTAIAAQSFREQKLAIARQILATTCLTTDQVKALAPLFNFEEDRLEFVKAAYPKVTDRDSYWKLNGVFGFERSKEELDAFLKGGR